MPEPSASGLLTSIGAAMGALAAVIGLVIKLGQMVNRAGGRQWDIKSFEAISAAHRAEIERSHADLVRLRLEKDEAILRLEVENQSLERRLAYRREENHWLNNMVTVYIGEYGAIKMETPRPIPPEEEESE